MVLGCCRRLTRVLEGNLPAYMGNRRRHAVGSRGPAAGRCPAPRPGDCRPPAARHLDGLHPLSPLATTVFILGFFDRYHPVRTMQMRRLQWPPCGAALGGHGCFLLPGLAPGRRVARLLRGRVSVLRPGCLAPLSWPPRHDGAGRTDVGSRRGPGSCGSGPPRRR